MKTSVLFRPYPLIIMALMLLVAGARVLPTNAQTPPTPSAVFQIALPIIQTANVAAAINNGDFEQGHSAWNETSVVGFPVIFNTGFSVIPHSGQYLAWLGGTNAETNTLTQSITFAPGSTNYLRYHYLIDSGEGNCTFDTARVLINTTIVAEHALCISSNTPSWASASIDLSSYAGQNVTLSFQASTDESVISNLFIDDISFQSTP